MIGGKSALRTAAAIGLALGIGGAVAAPPNPASAAAQAVAPAGPASVAVDGFRSAHWGMNAAEVKAAIQHDFGIPATKVASTENAAERTTVLTTTVPELIDGAGTARISYILGYKSRTLIQVTIMWGTPADPRVPPENIVTAANQLRQLLLDSGYEPRTIIANRQLADGSFLVFEGEDAQRHTTLLRLTSTSSPAKGPQNKTRIINIVLSLSYALDSRNPDMFRLKKGQF